MKGFHEAVKERRSIYSISKETDLSDEKILRLIEEAVKYTPSAFNSQSARVVVLFGESHNQLWDLTKEQLRKIVPEDQFSSTEERINSFRSGHGTVVYFEDMQVVESLQREYALYKDNFPIWAQQSNGMLQYVIWTALEIEGLGASLQHYNELIEEEVKKQWDIPEQWKMIGQMPFGKPTARADAKEFFSLEERIKVFK